MNILWIFQAAVFFQMTTVLSATQAVLTAVSRLDGLWLSRQSKQEVKKTESGNDGDHEGDTSNYENKTVSDE